MMCVWIVYCTIDIKSPVGKIDMMATPSPSVRPSERLSSVPLSGIRKLFDLVTPETVNLGIGEPDFQPPAEAMEGLRQACADGRNKYGPTNGVPALREAIAEYSSRYNEGIGAENVIVTPSGTAALMTIMQAFIDPGDEVLLPDPGFVVYRPHIMLAGGVPREYGLTPGDFQPSLDSIQESLGPRTKAIIVNSPSNPTGGVMDLESRRAIGDIAADKGIMVVSDEVYDRFVYEGQHHSFLDDLENCIVVNAFSKSMAATGWRLGYAMSNSAAIDEIGKMQYHMTACPNTPMQFGLLQAMPCIERFISEMVPAFDARRRLITERLKDIEGFHLEPPRGSFYAFPSYEADIASADLAMMLVKEGLVCTPGSAFGAAGEGHLRFSYATSEEMIGKGMDILERVAAKL